MTELESIPTPFTSVAVLNGTSTRDLLGAVVTVRRVGGFQGRLKQIFDPYNILNPGVKLGSSVEDVKSLARNDYSLGHMYNHLPRS